MRSLTGMLVLLAVAFTPTLEWIWDGWMLSTGYYSHGPLLVIAAAWLLYERRTRLAAASRRSSRTALVVLAGLLLLHLAGQALMVDGLSGFVFVPALLALVWAREGRARLAVAAPCIALLFFAVPLPIFVTGQIAYEMKHVATAAAVVLGNVIGLGLEQRGANILVAPGAWLVVGDACSGLRSLVALVSLGYVYALFLTRRRVWGRAVFVLLAVPVALLTNFLRIVVLAAIARSKGVEFATTTAHDVSGWLLYLVALGLLVLIDRVLPGRLRLVEPACTVDTTGAAPARAGLAPAVLIAVLGLPALVLGYWHPGSDAIRFADAIPRETARFASKAEEDPSFHASWYDLLGTHDVCWRDYREKATGRRATLVAIFQGSKWKSLHPPEVCLIAAGLEIVASERRSLEVGGRDYELSVLVAGRHSDRHLVGYTFGAPGWTTPSFYSFFFHNVPRALLRRDARGYLIRVDIPWPLGMPRLEAERMLAAFLSDMLPVMERLMRKGAVR